MARFRFRLSRPLLLTLCIGFFLAGGCSRPAREGAMRRSGGSESEPFRVKETPVTDSGPDQVLVADFNGDGVPDTLRLYQSEPSQPAGSESVQSRQIRVTIATGGPGARVFTVVDETWAVDGKVAVSVVSDRTPPPFAVGVPNSDERYWYQWDGQTFRQVGSVEQSYE